MHRTLIRFRFRTACLLGLIGFGLSPVAAPALGLQSPFQGFQTNPSPQVGLPVARQDVFRSSPLRVIPSTQSGVNLPGTSFRPSRIVLPQWQSVPGPFNAITDVPGLQVGQVTVMQENPRIRTGITAIVPNALLHTQGGGNLATTGYRAGAAVLSGNGELTGLGLIQGFGVLNSPILLTNTRSVGVVHQGVDDFMDRTYPGQWSGQLPVVGECWDGFFNTMEIPVLKPVMAQQAILAARPGPVLQGRTGAGTGMRSFSLHAGIGSASRQTQLAGKTYTLGVLVNTNHSGLEDINPQVRQLLEQRLGSMEALMNRDSQDRAQRPPSASPRQGSIMVVIATDLPLNPRELQSLAEHAGLGIGAMGSTMATHSGDFAIAFSTASPYLLGSKASELVQNSEVHPDALSPILKATVEAVQEAQINALLASHTH